MTSIWDRVWIFVLRSEKEIDSLGYFYGIGFRELLEGGFPLKIQNSKLKYSFRVSLRDGLTLQNKRPTYCLLCLDCPLSSSRYSRNGLVASPNWHRPQSPVPSIPILLPASCVAAFFPIPPAAVNPSGAVGDCSL